MGKLSLEQFSVAYEKRCTDCLPLQMSKIDIVKDACSEGKKKHFWQKTKFKCLLSFILY